jgi:hypothetical protein
MDRCVFSPSTDTFSRCIQVGSVRRKARNSVTGDASVCEAYNFYPQSVERKDSVAGRRKEGENESKDVNARRAQPEQQDRCENEQSIEKLRQAGIISIGDDGCIKCELCCMRGHEVGVRDEKKWRKHEKTKRHKQAL